MAKRDLDNEFRDKLKGQGPFQFSEENWNAASAMLDKELPVSKRGWLFNRATILLSVLVVFLFSVTLILPISSAPSVEPNETESQSSSRNISNTKPNLNPVTGNSSSISSDNSPNDNNEEPIRNTEAERVLTPNSNVENESPGIEERTAKNESGIDQEKSNDLNSDNQTIVGSQIKTLEQSTNDLVKIGIATSANNTEAPKQEGKPELINTSYATHSSVSEEQTAIDEKEQIAFDSNENSTNTQTEIPSENNGEVSNPGLTDDLEEVNATTSNAQIDKNEQAEEINAFGNDDGVQSQIPQPNAAPSTNYLRLGFESGLFSTTRTLKALDPDCEEYVVKRNSQEIMKPSYYFGLNFGQQINKLNWQLGLNYSVYQENISYNNEVLGLDILDNGYWNQFNSIDTSVSSKWVIDSIFVGHWEFDTTLTNVVDSNYVEQWDTTMAVKLDSTIEQNNGVHSLSYFEVPLFLGYTFGKDKWLFDLQPGVSIGFLSGSRGSRYIDKSLTGLVDQANSAEQLNKVIWKAHFRVGVRYSMHKWDVGIYPHYSYTLNNVLKSTKVDQRYGNLGISLGVYYKL